MSIPGVPDGWELVRLGSAKRGEWYMLEDGSIRRAQDDHAKGLFDPIIRRIEKLPTYRPFANAEEFKPHRDRWWRWKGDDCVFPPAGYTNNGVIDHSWEYLYQTAEFDDGSPFGVKVEPAEKEGE